MRLRQQHGGAHAVAEREPRLRAQRRQDLVAQRDEVSLIDFKIVDMAFARIAELTFGQTLPAPVQCDDGEAAGKQFCDGFEIALDEFGAPRKNHDSATLRWPALPTRNAQVHAILRGQCGDDRAVWDGIGGDADQVQDKALPSQYFRSVCLLDSTNAT